MGGRGSGNWYRSGGPTNQDMLRLDVRPLIKRNCFPMLSWHRGEREVASLACLTLISKRTMTLIYTANDKPIRESFPIVSTACAFGGSRNWVQCLSCYQPVAVLYGHPFRCRRCHGLSYESQREAKWKRSFARSDVLRKKLGGEPSPFGAGPLPPKPKGMHWRTYYRLCDELARVEAATTTVLLARFG